MMLTLHSEGDNKQSDRLPKDQDDPPRESEEQACGRDKI